MFLNGVSYPVASIVFMAMLVMFLLGSWHVAMLQREKWKDIDE